jgi:anthranilate synthase/indole-3-glycerol phosphate synthase/phosphoribosylanthranilate isomerase
MCGIREAIGAMGESRRPALLRKDFVLDEYQIYEARYYGADTVLLIVAALGNTLSLCVCVCVRVRVCGSDDMCIEEAELVRLIKCSRQLGMEPLVETANAEEMEVALRVGSKVIGINNRNLHTFSVDLNTTNRLLADVAQSAEGVIFTALSGITTRFLFVSIYLNIICFCFCLYLIGLFVEWAGRMWCISRRPG